MQSQLFILPSILPSAVFAALLLSLDDCLVVVRVVSSLPAFLARFPDWGGGSCAVVPKLRHTNLSYRRDIFIPFSPHSTDWSTQSMASRTCHLKLRAAPLKVQLFCSLQFHICI